ncbi:MAG: hypothetical protein LBJ61_02300 [Deltaproteobacteria bacterium]|jgi:hypothetical protein|nr:hypothetical protein [Deltaproteobacteria bacterium]
MPKLKDESDGPIYTLKEYLPTLLVHPAKDWTVRAYRINGLTWLLESEANNILGNDEFFVGCYLSNMIGEDDWSLYGTNDYLMIVCISLWNDEKVLLVSMKDIRKIRDDLSDPFPEGFVPWLEARSIQPVWEGD